MKTLIKIIFLFCHKRLKCIVLILLRKYDPSLFLTKYAPLKQLNSLL